jgi:hypothetical protein
MELGQQITAFYNDNCKQRDAVGYETCTALDFCFQFNFELYNRWIMQSFEVYRCYPEIICQSRQMVDAGNPDVWIPGAIAFNPHASYIRFLEGAKEHPGHCHSFWYKHMFPNKVIQPELGFKAAVEAGYDRMFVFHTKMVPRKGHKGSESHWSTGPLGKPSETVNGQAFYLGQCADYIISTSESMRPHQKWIRDTEELSKISVRAIVEAENIYSPKRGWTNRFDSEAFDCFVGTTSREDLSWTQRNWKPLTRVPEKAIVQKREKEEIPFRY